MFVATLKRSMLSLIGALALAITFLFALFTKDDFLLAGKSFESSYYLYSSSTCAVQTPFVKLWELPFVEGKSFCLQFDDGAKAKEYALTLAKEKGAKLQRAEFVAGVESYYYFLANGGECVRVAGLPVNLHIAVRGRFVSVGAPIIFGGY
jgi:hypothetical protein